MRPATLSLSLLPPHHLQYITCLNCPLSPPRFPPYLSHSSTLSAYSPSLSAIRGTLVNKFADATKKPATRRPNLRTRATTGVGAGSSAVGALLFDGYLPHAAEAIVEGSPVTMRAVSKASRDHAATVSPSHLVIRFTTNDGWGPVPATESCHALELTTPGYTMTARYPDAVYDESNDLAPAAWDELGREWEVVARTWERFLLKAEVVDIVGDVWNLEERNPGLYPVLQGLHAHSTPWTMPLDLIRLIPDASGSMPREALIPAAGNVVVFAGHVKRGFFGSSVVQRIHLAQAAHVTTVVSFHPVHPKAPVTLPILDYNPSGTSGETACRPRSMDRRYGALKDWSDKLRTVTLVFRATPAVPGAQGEPPTIPCDYETSQEDGWDETPARVYGEPPFERFTWLIHDLPNELRRPGVKVTVVGLELVPKTWWSGWARENEDTHWDVDMEVEVREDVFRLLVELRDSAPNDWATESLEPIELLDRLTFKTLAKFEGETDAEQFSLLTVRPTVGNASVGLIHY
ncbi:uncharacterized protein LOC62_07G009586 [Vanrija pseudolonga]|uniref:Uncharacterized protein n=1 Tax=Vanrija pseudolonga TaxID=143232 RepID=A0AAF1BMC1_9TREE|nr:hypothetical protein LOC62_07G009586 [Vanrija pseudolonga]